MIPKLALFHEMNFEDIFLNIAVTDVFSEGMGNDSDMGESFAAKNNKFDKMFCISSIDMTSNGINTKREARSSPVLLEYVAPNRVYVDRPFIIIIMDCKYHIPLLLGAVMDS